MHPQRGEAFEVEAVGCYGQEMRVEVPGNRRKIARHQVDEVNGEPFSVRIAGVTWIKRESACIRGQDLVGIAHGCNGDWPWIAEQLIAEGVL